MQLLRAGLFPAITRDCRTAFTFHVLNDFLLDNVECSTTAMNYYSKLCRVTSNAFLHLVPRHLKLLKWKGFHAGACDPGLGDLVLFCPACLQPGIIIPPGDNIDMSDYRWKYSWVIVMSGNFKAEHMALKNTDSEFWLMDGHGYMVGLQRYKAYLTGTETRVTMQPTQRVIHFCNINYQYSINLQQWIAANPLISILEGIHIQPEIGIWHVHGHQSECFTQYAPNFIPGVGNNDGNPVVILEHYLTIHVWNEMLDFQMNDRNFCKMIRMHKGCI
ncbi:hypothetical protein V8B97DRAFT_2024227 [Scleroderma yunnanense]